MINRPARKLKASQQVRAFTLIEVLVVIALTVILLTLLFAPLIQAFGFTAQAQATAQAQDAARSTTEQMTRELGSAAGVRDTSANYLDLPILSNTGTVTLAHAYNAYIDIVPPKVSTGSIIDPTIDNNNPTLGLGSINGTSGVYTEFSPTGVELPLSAGTTVIRYFVGLRYPINPQYVAGEGEAPGASPAEEQPYTNPFEGMKVASGGPYSNSYVVKHGLANTYQLYRVNFQPYTTVNGVYGPNKELLPTVNNAGVTPIYDDPDFFRMVNVGETDYVANQGDNGTYTIATAEAHNDRVYYWYKIAKEVISTRDIDLAGLVRVGGKVVYDSSGYPVNGSYDTDHSPILRTTVSFAPGLIANDPMAATNTSDTSEDYGSYSSGSTLPYIPSEFAAEYGNWQGTPVVTITKTNPTTSAPSYLQTTTATSTNISGYVLGYPNYSSTGQTSPVAGDMILCQDTSGTIGTPVYDITAGAPIVASLTSSPSTYDALLLNETSGVVSFAIPALPPPLNGQSASLSPPNTYWAYTSNASTGTIDLTSLSSLETGAYASTPTASQCPLVVSGGTETVPNAYMVVNSERVIGPDNSTGIVGTATTNMVQYTRVPSNPGADQYSVNYQAGTITLQSGSALNVQIAYSYQNNLSPNTTAGSATEDTADTVRSSYYTGSIIRLNIGIRVYSSSTGVYGAANSVSQYFSLNSQVGVGNSKAN